MSDVPYQALTGDTVALSAKGKKYHELAEQIGKSVVALSKISDDSSVSSDAMTELRQLAGNVKTDIEKTAVLYSLVGDQVVIYGGQLGVAKEVADPAADRIADLEQSAWPAEVRMSDAYDAYDAADRRWRIALMSNSDQDTLRRLKNASDSAWVAYWNAQTDLSTLNDELGRQQRIWTNNDGHSGGKELKDTAAAAAASQIDATFSDPRVKGLEDGFWDKFKDFWDNFYKILSVICDIAGFLSLFLGWVPFLGQVLLILGTIGKILNIINAVIQVVDATMKAFSGELGLGGLLGAYAMAALAIFGDKLLGAAGKRLSGLGSEGQSFGKLFANELKSPFTKWTASGSEKLAYQFMRGNFSQASGLGKVTALFQNAGSNFLAGAGLRFAQGSTGSAAGDSALRFMFGGQGNYIGKIAGLSEGGPEIALFAIGALSNNTFKITNTTINLTNDLKSGDLWGALGDVTGFGGPMFDGNWSDSLGGAKSGDKSGGLDGNPWSNIGDSWNALTS